MSHELSWSNASKLFVKIPKRFPSFRTSINALFHNSSWPDYSYVQDPVGVSVEEENVISWTSKISNLVRKNRPHEAIGLFKTMLLNHQKPNYVTVLSVIRAIGQLVSENMASMIHGFMIKTAFNSEISDATALLGVYSDWDIMIAKKLFEQTPHKDVVLWSAMISACVKNAEYVEAFEVFREMQICGLQPNQVTVVSALSACADLGALPSGKEIHGFSIKRAFYCDINVQNSLLYMYAKCGNLTYPVQLFSRMQKKDLISWRSMIRGCVENEFPVKTLSTFSEMRICGFQPDEIVIRDIIAASSQLEVIKLGLGLHGLVLKIGFLAVISMVTALLQMYAKFGEVGSARILFDYLYRKDLIAWSSMISAYAQNGQPSNAFDIYRHMQSAGEKPNEVTFVSLLQSCSSMAAQEIGESIQSNLTKAGYMSNTFLTSALIDMYCKLGRIRKGEALFDENPTRDLVCWSSMINGYGINGLGDEALGCFSKMLHHGIKPNDVVFISVLAACSHCGLEYEGWNWFSAMQKKYGLTPKLAHYACMVDMLSRQGNVEAALEFVRNMPIEPDKRVWGALLAGCRKSCGSSEISELVAKQLLRQDPGNSSSYVILSSLYAEQGRWKEVEELRESVDLKGLKKVTGYSMI